MYILIDWKAFAILRKAVNLPAEVALDHLSLGVVVVVALHNHLVDVSSARSLSTWKEARIVEHFVAVGELAHHGIFKRVHLSFVSIKLTYKYFKHQSMYNIIHNFKKSNC